jgi:hypothetical protein
MNLNFSLVIHFLFVCVNDERIENSIENENSKENENSL